MKENKLIKQIQYLNIGCNKNDGYLSVHFKSEKANETVDQIPQIQMMFENLWNSSLGLFTTIIGCQNCDIQPSRWKEHYSYGERFFNAPAWKEFHWKSFNGIIHFRDWLLYGRDIDNYFIDLFLMFSADNYEAEYNEDIKLADSPGVINELIEFKSQIQEALSSIAKVVLNDNSVNVKISNPLWEEECVPVYGGDGYWIKGIIV